MLKIRLSRVGKSHTPIYRLVVAEKSRAVKRENLEVLGLYNPGNKQDKFQVKKDRVLYWISQGAEPSDTARNLLCDFGVLPKEDKIKTVHGKPNKKKAKKDEGQTPAPAEVKDEAVTEQVEEPEQTDSTPEEQGVEAPVTSDETEAKEPVEEEKIQPEE